MPETVYSGRSSSVATLPSSARLRVSKELKQLAEHITEVIIFAIDKMQRQGRRVKYTER